jgi:hypothetical protein
MNKFHFTIIIWVKQLPNRHMTDTGQTHDRHVRVKNKNVVD